MASICDENWSYLLSLLPAGWEAQAKHTGAVQRLRGSSCVGDLLRTLLLHIGHGCSLRTTSVVAKAAGWAAMSDVALLNKIRLCEPWLQWLCLGVLQESQMSLPAGEGPWRWRLVDSTLVKEPGDTGSCWRVLYSLRVPDWQCDFFRLTPWQGKGNGESLKHFAIKKNDCILADRGFSHLAGIGHVVAAGGHLIVRLNEQNTPLEQRHGEPLDLLAWLPCLEQPGQVGSLSAWVRPDKEKSARIAVRLCAIRKSLEATTLAHRKLKRRAQRSGVQLRPQTLEHSSWVVVLTTLPEEAMRSAQVLEWYRLRWQIELAFKRLKSLADVGHLPKKDSASSKAWVYGKLLIALLTEKMQRHAASFSPWGGRWLDQDPPSEHVA